MCLNTSCKYKGTSACQQREDYCTLDISDVLDGSYDVFDNVDDVFGDMDDTDIGDDYPCEGCVGEMDDSYCTNCTHR